MQERQLRELLEALRKGQLSPDEALRRIKMLPFEDLSFAMIDHHREIRQGAPEVVYCEGKTVEQVVAIMERLVARASGNIIATRADARTATAVRERIPEAEYHQEARLIAVRKGEQRRIGLVLVVSAGTADIPVAEEAALTAELMGSRVERLYDVGVAGIHRLLRHHDRLLAARTIVVVAGMEGALASVVGGLVDKPVVAVPTSVGYGANFKGLAALLTMLNSCASGVVVVNIDNGFGAGYAAALINRLGEVAE